MRLCQQHLIKRIRKFGTVMLHFKFFSWVTSGFLLMTLCKCVSGEDDNSNNITAVMTPKRQISATGSNLTFNCTPNASSTKTSARGLYFRSNNSQLEASFKVKVLHKSGTAMLILANVQRNMSGVIECSHLKSNITLDSAFLMVADKPKKPDLKECRVKNWKKMKCSFNGQNDNGIQTKVTLVYSREYEFNPSRLYACPNPSYNSSTNEHSCEWSQNGLDHLIMSLHHWLLILAENEVGHDYSVFGIDPSLYVEPAKLNLSCNASGPRVAICVWKSPRAREELIYRVRWKSGLDGTKLISSLSEMKSTSNNVSLSNLLPNTNYIVFVDCIPVVRGAERGYWSEEASTNFKTPVDDAFGQNPMIYASIGDRVVCVANTSVACDYKWKWFEGDDVTTESYNKTLIPRKQGLHKCEATCDIKNHRCTMLSMTALVSANADVQKSSAETKTSPNSFIPIILHTLSLSLLQILYGI